MTDWGDYGHLQYLPFSYAGFAMGAGCSWCLETNERLALADVLDLHAFEDDARAMGKMACDLGNVYQATGVLVGNASSLFRILVPPKTPKVPAAGISPEGLDSAERAIDLAIAPLPKARMRLDDADLIKGEFRNAAAMLKFTCKLGRQELGQSRQVPAESSAKLRRIMDEHRRLWLLRNRPGGLADSIGRLEKLQGT
jgi:hypothetical protein